MKQQQIQVYARPQVKATLQAGNRLYLATEVGLYQLCENHLTPVDKWRGVAVQHLARTPDGYLLLQEDSHGQVLYQCDESWEVLKEIDRPEGHKIKCFCMTETGLLVGTKAGLFRQQGKGWKSLFQDAHGRGEILWVQADGHSVIRASVKKMGYDAVPALIESLDTGCSWKVTQMQDYQDLVLAANQDWIVTRWKGARRRYSPAGYKKHPLSAASLLPDGWAVVDGDKLEVERAGHATLAFRHPMLAESERLQLLDQGVLIAGVQGAYLVDPATSTVTDLFAELETDGSLGKLKRIFRLDQGALLATATYGTFRSEDAGESWLPVRSEWSVLDAECMTQSADGRWWLACQRALFVSCDNGLSWDYVKLKCQTHHYSELRGGVVVLGDHLYIGTKAGLLSATLDDPEKVSWVTGLDGVGIEALKADQSSDQLIVGTEQGELYLFSPTQAYLKLQGHLPLLEVQVAGTASHCVMTVEDKVFELSDGVISEVTPDSQGGDFSLLSLDDQSDLLLWNQHHAWRGVPGGAFRRLPEWPEGVRHVAFLPQQQMLLTTDRARLQRITLQG